MQNNESNTFTDKDASKKPKNLPPILNQSPSKPMQKKQSNNSESNLVQAKVKQTLIVINNSSSLRKERKFIVDEYDEKAVVLCQFCGGQTCPQEDFRKNKIQPNAIQGLHSNWINENILATQRPSNRLIKQYNLLQTFQKYNLNSILNLQEPGQHPYCGDGIDPMVGFSYDPQLFFNRKIRFQNQYWEDMTSTTFEQMMKIMNIFYRSIIQRRGKIAVHCHAGRGRTLMAINSWLIFNDRMTAEQTIDLAILKRQGVLTKNSQRDFLRDFQKELKFRWKSYSFDLQKLQAKTFSDFVAWQHGSLLKSQRQKLNQTSYIHGTILAILRNRMQQSCKQIIFSFIDLNDKSVFGQKKWDQQNEHRLNFLKSYLDQKKFDAIKQNEEIRVLVALIQDFYDNIPFTPLSLHAVDKLKQQLEIQRQILEKEGLKRHVKKETFSNKILKRWEDIIKERQDFVQSPTKEEHKQKKESGQDINQRLQSMQVTKQTDQIKDENELVNNENLLQNNSGIYQPNNTGFTQESFIKNDDKGSSQIQITSLFLNVLTEPSIVHEVGLNSMCTFIDFVKFAMELMNCYKDTYPNQTQEHFDLIEKCLLAKFSLLLQSKKKYFPVIFRGKNLRESILMKKIEKLDKYMNKNIKYMSQVFMKQLMEELQTFLKDEVQQKFQKLIFKIQKVNANIEYYSKTHANTGGKFFNAKDAKKVYDSARI